MAQSNIDEQLSDISSCSSSSPLSTVRIKKEKIDATELHIPLAGISIKKEQFDIALNRFGAPDYDSITTTSSPATTPASTPARNESPMDIPNSERHRHRRSNERNQSPADQLDERSNGRHRSRNSGDRRSPSRHDSSRSSRKHERSRHHHDRHSEIKSEDDRHFGRDRKPRDRNDTYDRTPRDRNSDDRYERISRRSRDRQLSPAYGRSSNDRSSPTFDRSAGNDREKTRFKDQRSPEREERNRSTSSANDRYGSPDYDIIPRPSTSGHRPRDDNSHKSRYDIWSDPVPVDKRNTLEYAVKSEFERHKRAPFQRGDQKQSVFNRLGAKIVEPEPIPNITVVNPVAVASQNVDAIPLPPPFIHNVATALVKPPPTQVSDSVPLEPPPLTQAEIDEANSDNEGRFGETEDDLNAKQLNELQQIKMRLQNDIIKDDPRQKHSLWISKSAPKPNVAVPPIEEPKTTNSALWTPKNAMKKSNAAVFGTAAKPEPSLLPPMKEPKPTHNSLWTPNNAMKKPNTVVTATAVKPGPSSENLFNKPQSDDAKALFERPYLKNPNVVVAPTPKVERPNGFSPVSSAVSAIPTNLPTIPISKEVANLLKDEKVMGMLKNVVDASKLGSPPMTQQQKAPDSTSVSLSATLENIRNNSAPHPKPLNEISSPTERLAYKYNPKPRQRSDEDQALPIEPVGRTAIVQPRVNTDISYRVPVQPSLTTTAVHPYQHHPTISHNDPRIRSRDPRLAAACSSSAHNTSPQYFNSPPSLSGHSPMDLQSAYSPGILSPNSPDDAWPPYSFATPTKPTHQFGASSTNNNNLDVFPHTFRNIEAERLKYEQSRKNKWNNQPTTAKQTYGEYRRSKDANQSKDRSQMHGKSPVSSSTVVSNSSTVGAKSTIPATAKSQLDNMYATGNYATAKPSNDTNFKIPKLNKKPPTTESVVLVRQATEKIVDQEPMVVTPSQTTNIDTGEENWDNEDTGIVFDVESHKQKPDSTLLNDEPDSSASEQDKKEEEPEETREPTPPAVTQKRVLRKRTKSLDVRPKALEKLRVKSLKSVEKPEIRKNIVPETSCPVVKPKATETETKEPAADPPRPEASASPNWANVLADCMKKLVEASKLAEKPEQDTTTLNRDRDSVLQTLSTIIGPEKYDQVKRVLGLMDDERPSGSSETVTAGTAETDDTVSASDADDTASIADTTVVAKRKPFKKTPRMNELQKLNEDIRTMFISDGVLTATGRRMCTVNNKESPPEPTTKRGRQTVKTQLPKAVMQKLDLPKDEPKGE